MIPTGALPILITVCHFKGQDVGITEVILSTRIREDVQLYIMCTSLCAHLSCLVCECQQTATSHFGGAWKFGSPELKRVQEVSRGQGLSLTNCLGWFCHKERQHINALDGGGGRHIPLTFRNESRSLLDYMLESRTPNWGCPSPVSIFGCLNVSNQPFHIAFVFQLQQWLPFLPPLVAPDKSQEETDLQVPARRCRGNVGSQASSGRARMPLLSTSRAEPRCSGGRDEAQGQGQGGALAVERLSFPARCPSLPFFGWEGSPTKIDYRKKVGTNLFYPLYWRT